MADTDLSSTSLGLAAYAEFADRYASVAPTKAHNALYERPATIALVGDVSGLRILDAGCGPGIFSEIFARNGATVHAFDITPRMVELARIRCAGLPVTLAEGNLAEPLNWLQDASFDKIVCALALDYVADLAPVFKEFRRVASPGATLVFSMSHPMRDWMDERTHGAWTYFDTSRFDMYWGGFGEPKPFVQSYRRPLAAILNDLVESGWNLESLVEPKPLEEMKTVDPEHYAELSMTPAFICVRARC